VLIGLFWTSSFVCGWLELTTFERFAARMATIALLVLGFTIWWITNGHYRWIDRLLGISAMVGVGVATAFLTLDTFGPFALVLIGTPYVFTAWVLWLLVARKASAPTRRIGMLGAILLGWAPLTLIRMDGLNGEQQLKLHWRWTPTAEELYLAERAQRNADGGDPSIALTEPITYQPGDWPGFRGPRRDGVVRGVKIATDWKTSPPLWRQRVGPAWSSIAVVGNRLYTQEQRGQFEAVVCLDADNGREIWVHEDGVRFFETLAGAGPRATPTFHDGYIYALGATGILNCLDAATGELKWSHNIADDSGAKLPQWGFASSPLVVRGVVIVFAGGVDDKGLLAYRAKSGYLAWTAAAGQTSYTSPQPATVEGQDQVLFLSDHGLTAIDPAAGAVLWEHPLSAKGAPRSLQPHPVSRSQILFSSETDLGTALLDVSRDGQSWTATQRWVSRDLMPSFNDYVIHDGFIYGFDGAVFCCVDAQTGERRWKKGRYGHGQVLLLADQPLLLVVTEEGDAVLVAANPEEHRQLGKFRAIEGKTWSHPVIAHGRLYIRNAEEMACYELDNAKSR
jgi:outer membrane protein assembly factor BamB